MDPDEVKICPICTIPYKGYGNNAAPVRPGERCCDYCNEKFVMPARQQDPEKG